MASPGEVPLVPQRVENAMKKRLGELALVDCEPEIGRFAECAHNRTVSVVWACRDDFLLMKKCTAWWGEPQHLNRYKVGYVELQKERGVDLINFDTTPKTE